MVQARGEQFQRDQKAIFERIQKFCADTNAARPAFLAELQQVLLRHGGINAAPHIAGLTALHSRETMPEVEQAIRRALVDLDAARASPEERITLLRSLGLPEPRVLDDTARQMARAIGSRRGPRNQAEALVFAARNLLQVPLPDARPPGQSRNPGTR